MLRRNLQALGLSAFVICGAYENPSYAMGPSDCMDIIGNYAKTKSSAVKYTCDGNLNYKKNFVCFIGFRRKAVAESYRRDVIGCFTDEAGLAKYKKRDDYFTYYKNSRRECTVSDVRLLVEHDFYQFSVKCGK